MDKDTALKLALEALENHEGNYKLNDAGCDRHDKAITAIKQALAAQQDHEPENEPHVSLASVQEPAAKYIGECSEGSLVQLYEDVKKGTNFYTTPPAQPAPVQSCYCPNCEEMGRELAALKARPAPVQKPLRGWWAHTNPETGLVDVVGYQLTQADKAHGWIEQEIYTTPPTPAAPVQPIIGSYLEKDNSQFKFSDYESDGVHHNKPAVPDAFGTREGEHPQYIQGWNDCRAEMLKGMKL
jgi:hypothetical protein